MNRERGPDPRLNAYREDLAAAHLRGEVKASRFAEGVDRLVRASVLPLLRRPEANAPMDTQLLFGETFRVFEEKNGWAWGQSLLDDYVGYVEAKELSPRALTPTHTVAALRTFVYPKPDLKTRPATPLSMNAKVKVGGARGSYSELETGGWVFSAHLAPIGSHVRDFVSVAEEFTGVPYLWGGRDSMGLDCSGLVQMSLERAGIASLRDTDMQEATLGEALPEPIDFTKLARGDLVFWKGHVGIMADAERMIHANAHHMRVAVERLDIAMSRIARSDAGHVTSIKRLVKR
ncbi:NlpC/P60 family protein [Parvibaculum sp.]|uniref:C40 family peptidase n=1 Tax=Parvibaculum sp. TaxID=2024848 RepID=UPI001B2AE6EC|nr:NlpC/P60 family protein [Parvibaculum sp.]MBO6666559.1 C40 family peptidase [Parvibaculum sp.]MBO6692350.1 C40 family peptidase [Parvibaculum sp.]MBO6713180.1 C40 family peptidase [Parvibaculum sp.]